MHEAAFARAALSAPCQVLGLPLRPYSLWHELALEREVQSPKSKVQSPEDALATSVLICCESRVGYQRLITDWLLKLKLWILKRRLRKVDWKQNLQAFEAYRAEGSLEFPLSNIVRPGSGSPSRPPGTPFLLRLHQFLVTRLHKSEAEAWDYPLGLAKMQWAAYWEEEGGLQVYNWQDAEHDAFVAQCEAEDAAAAAAASNQLPVTGDQSGQTSAGGLAESQSSIAKEGSAVKAELAHFLQVMDDKAAATRLDCVAIDGCKVSLPIGPAEAGTPDKGGLLA